MSLFPKSRSDKVVCRAPRIEMRNPNNPIPLPSSTTLLSFTHSGLFNNNCANTREESHKVHPVSPGSLEVLLVKGA
ncbi:hypothetical protein Gasu2_55740 [Galdieria sulphuraria]|nr:hypothetical protein Gasu2_55740 [Galdieria sulphuraria]